MERNKTREESRAVPIDPGLLACRVSIRAALAEAPLAAVVIVLAWRGVRWTEDGPGAEQALRVRARIEAGALDYPELLAFAAVLVAVGRCDVVLRLADEHLPNDVREMWHRAREGFEGFELWRQHVAQHVA